MQPKYIHNILKHAEKRKLEGERRKERQVQKEREMEGEEFADKESFVTASYLKKMEELKQAEEKARLEELQEGVCLCSYNVYLFLLSECRFQLFFFFFNLKGGLFEIIIFYFKVHIHR